MNARRTRGLRGSVALTLAALSFAATARAQEQLEISSLDLDGLLDLDVEASTKSALPISESPGVASVVTREQIRDFAWMSLNDVLYRLPGFAPARDYERRTVSARGQFDGWNNNHLLLLVDGLPHNDNETGAAFTWEATPLFFVRRIEVVRGPGSALYGGNAMAGVVALDTVSAADFDHDTVAGSLRVGSRNTVVMDALATHRTEHVDVVVGANRYETDGDEYLDTDGSERLDGDGALEKFQVQDGRDARYLFFKAEGKGALSGLTLQLHDQDTHFQTGHGWYMWTPDVDEKLQEGRQIVSLAWRPRHGRFSHEYALQYQRHGYRQDIHYFPAGAVDTGYPDGVDEFIETAIHSVFGRAQVTAALPRDASAVAGAEYTVLLYGGDKAHYANAMLGNPAGEDPLDQNMPLGPIYERMLHHPVHRLGAFANFTSGELLGSRLALTAGLRVDDLFFDYTDTDAPAKPTGHESYGQLSPRAGLVAFPTRWLSVKLLVGHAFRTPSPIELFGANTWTTYSDIHALHPESLDSYEAALDASLPGPLRLRVNGYYIDHRDQIGWGQDAILNLYSNRRAGLEAEVLGELALGHGLQLGGFASYSLATLIDEHVDDPALMPSDRITWTPAQTAKLGLRLVHARWSASVQLYGQGPTARRPSDRQNAMFLPYRPEQVPSWATVDAAVRWSPNSWGSLALQATNLLGSRGGIAAPLDLPFDYHVEPRQIMMTFGLDL